jgi:hypothetical protein
MSVDRRDLDELLALPLQPTVSILMPAARGGPDTRQSPIRMKNLTRVAERQLEAHGLEVEDAERLLAPVLSLGAGSSILAPPGRRARDLCRAELLALVHGQSDAA